MTISKVAILGANGKFGSKVLAELAANDFTVTVLNRQSSKSATNYPPNVYEIRVPDEFPSDFLETHLKGQDAVVVTLSSGLIDLQKRLALAAAKSGVQRFIPADYGSVDSESERARKLSQVYVNKKDFRTYLTELASDYPSFSWTSIVCGHFFDWSLDFMHIYPGERRMDVIDEGMVRASASSLAQVARAVAGILRFAGKEETRNTMVYVQSFCKTQMEVKEALERVTGEKWSSRKFEGERFLEENVRVMKEGSKEESQQAGEDVIWCLGAIEADWEGMDGFAMKVLELEEESVDDVVRAALESAK